MSTVIEKNGWPRVSIMGVGRHLDPRSSITGKLLAVTAGMLALTGTVVATGIWFVTTRFVTTAAGAQLVVDAGLLAFGLIAAGQLVGTLALRQAIVTGLLELERETRAIVDSGGLETGFETDRSDEIGQLAWRIAELREQLATQVETVESLNRELAIAATAHSRTLAACRDGDLTQRMETDSEVPQFEALATNFNEMIGETETMVAEVRSFSRSVVDAATETATSAEEIDDAAAAVTEATTAISDGVHHQHERTERTAAAMAGLTDNIDAIATEAATVADHSVHATKTTKSGVSAAEDALEELEAIRARTDEAVTEFEQLRSQVDDIEAITEHIAELADWIDQLAVNAQLESAKHNDGTTAVLGKRIKRVAADTDDAVATVEALADSISEQTVETQQRLDATEQAVDRGTETIESALGALTEIEQAIERTTHGITEIDEETELQAERTADIKSAIDDVQAIGTRTAREATAAEQAAETQQEAVTQIGSRLSWLASTATELETRLTQFTVRSAAASAPESAATSPTGEPRRLH